MHSLILLAHISLVCVSALIVLYSDEQALMWILGKKRVLRPSPLHLLHLALCICLLLLVATGSLLFWPVRAYLFMLPQFYIKMTLVFALIINAFFIERFSRQATVRSFQGLSSAERLPLFIVGAISVIGWIGAGLCGLLLK